MTQFKFLQYVCKENPTEESWGFLIHSYDYVDGELYLYSGTNNIPHHISTLKTKYQNNILKLINNK
jgi:hypothetical protein